MALGAGGLQVSVVPKTLAEVSRTCLCAGNKHRVGLCSRGRITLAKDRHFKV